MANCLFYSWEGGGHVFDFFSVRKGCHLFFFFGVDGHPSIVLFGRGSLLLFYLEGLATYLFFILSAGQDTDVF